MDLVPLTGVLVFGLACLMAGATALMMYIGAKDVALPIKIGSEALALQAVMAASGIALAYEKHPPLAYAVAAATGAASVLMVYNNVVVIEKAVE